MNPIILLDRLKEFVEEQTQNLKLPVRVDRESGESKERPPEVHIMRLPDRDAETKRIPYILLQFIKSNDVQQEGRPPESTCMVRIVVATYDEDGSNGAMHVLNVLTRLRTALLKDGVIGGQFLNIAPIETIVYPDSAPPYYLGEMMTTWQMPNIESEVKDIWQR